MDVSRRGYLTRVLVVYLGASYAVLEITDIFIDQLGLPDWFFPGVIVLLLIGLPIVVATALVQTRSREAEAVESEASRHEEAPASAAGVGAGSAGAGAKPVRPWLTWRKAIVGFVAAFAVWGLVVAVYMTMRAVGFGPVGSLVAAGVLEERDRIILAEFENNTSDPLLAQAATEAFRIDFSQSPIVTLMDPASVDRVLIRMQRDPGQPLDADMAREVAIREGVKAVVDGEITPVGRGFVLSARLVAARDGQVLTAHRETARDTAALIGAIDQLSKKLRERMGESLKTIRANEPLDQVTTTSLEALRMYSQAVRAAEMGDHERAIALLEEAVAVDTAFAMAWRKLGVSLGNIGRDRSRQVEALTKAHEHRDRLTDRERFMTLGSYHSAVTDDNERAIAAYQSLLEIYPNDTWAMNNLAILHLEARDYRRADQLFRRALEWDSAGGALYYGNTVTTRVALGDFDGASLTLERFSERFPEHPTVALSAAALASSQFDYETAREHVLALREAQRASEFWQIGTSFQLAQIAEVQGRLAEAEQYIQEAMAAAAAQDQGNLYVGGAIRMAFYDVMLRRDPDGALERIDSALERYPLSSLKPHERPYGGLALLYALTGHQERATDFLAEWDSAVDPTLRGDNGVEEAVARGVLALTENRPQEAIAEFRLADTGPCEICILPLLGMAFDAAEQPDSVMLVYEKYIETPWLNRLGENDWWALAGIFERLAGLYELNGNTEKAVHYYNRFVELWQDADPELQPRVAAAQRSIERLSAEQADVSAGL